MAFKVHLLLSLFLVNSVIIIDSFSITYGTASLNRSSFPVGFIFGTASASYQFEGGAIVGGRGPSIWDAFTHNYPDKIIDRSNGDVAVDEYHRYKEDVKIMKEMNLDAYRFSISWSRILPKGKLSGGVNREGIDYYNNLINELLDKGRHNYIYIYSSNFPFCRIFHQHIYLVVDRNKLGCSVYFNNAGLQPFVTLFHWDLPQSLEEEYGGFLSPKIINDFGDFAELCFKEFGDRVKHWITLNEPWSVSKSGYATGSFAPGRCSAWQNLNCIGGDSATEPYVVSHHQLLAHAAAVNLYKTKYQASQKGLIGITIACHWMVPLSDTELDNEAAERARDFMIGWFLEPVTRGRYPISMRSLVGRRLPKFSKEQRRQLTGSFDFLGINYYTTNYATHAPELSAALPSYLTDALVNLTSHRNGIPIGPRAASDWLYVYPKGFRELLLYINKKYNYPLIYITENGVDEFNDATLSLEQALLDTYRIDYYYWHLYYLQTAIKDGVNVKGYFAWSLLDNFEWSTGYSVRFGINFVDYNDGLKRYPKLSAHWFTNFLEQNIKLTNDM